MMGCRRDSRVVVVVVVVVKWAAELQPRKGVNKYITTHLLTTTDEERII